MKNKTEELQELGRRMEAMFVKNISQDFVQEFAVEKIKPLKNGRLYEHS